MCVRKPLSYLKIVSEDLLLEGLIYSMHLALNKGVKQVTACLLLPHQAQGVPICLQRTGSTKAVLSLPQKPVEECVQDVDGDAFEGGHRVLLSELAVSGGLGQAVNDRLGDQGQGLYWYQKFLTNVNILSLPFP